MYAQLIMLFALLFTGLFLYRAGLLNKAANLGINKMLLYFTFPCMIMYKIGTMEMTDRLFNDFIAMLILGMVSYGLFTAITIIYYRVRGIRDQVSDCAILSTILPNNGFIGYPVALVFLGESGLLMMIAHGAIAFNLFVFTFGINFLRKGKGENAPMTLKGILSVFGKLLINPIILSIPAGLIILFAHIPMDNIAGEYLSAISGMASPLAMIYVGSAVAEGDIMSTFKEGIIREISFVKLILIPVITALCVLWLPVSPLVKATLILGSSFPCAAIPVMLGQQEGLDYSQAGKALLFSTLLSVITIPLVIRILTVILPL